MAADLGGTPASGLRVQLCADARTWYAHLDIEEAIRQFRFQVRASRFKATEALLAKAYTRDGTQTLGKLTTMTDGRPRIISAPPMIVPV